MYFLLSRGLILHKLSKIVLSGKFTYGSRETELLAKAAQDKCIESRGCAYKLFTMQRKRSHWDVSPCNGNFIKPGCDHVHFRTRQQRGHPTSIFGKYISVRRTIWDLGFSERKISCLPTSPRILEHGIIAHFKRIFTLKRSPRICGSLFSGWSFRKGKFWSL